MERFFCVLLFLSSYVYGLPTSVKETLKSGNIDYEVIDIEVADEMNYYGSHIPESLHLKTKTFGKSIDVRVKKQPSIFHENYRMLSLELDSNDQPIFRVVKLQTQDQPIYQDGNKTCALHLSYEQGHLMMEGTLTPELSVIPTSSVGLLGQVGRHIVIKNKPGKSAIGNDYFDIPSFEDADEIPTKQSAELPKIVTPELLVIVDYKNARNMDFDDNDVQKYLAIFWNSVNTRYALVNEPQMQLLLIGSIITKDPKLQVYIEGARIIIDGKGGIDLYKTLPELHKFVYQNMDKIPAFDIAMLMTAEDMAATIEEDFNDNTIAGAAPVGSACNNGADEGMVTSVGMAEDMAPFYSGVLNHAHEIAHLLGSVHDGDPPYKTIPGHPGARDCPWRDGYLMSYNFGTQKHLRWSECTLNQFRFFLGLDRASCLLSVRSPTIFPLNATLPGQLLDLDEQCKAFMGPTGKYFRDQNMVKICSILYCYREDDIQNVISRGPAYEGSPCGYNEGPHRWCRDGTCRIKPEN